MATHPITQYLETTIMPLSLLGILIALFATFGPHDVPVLSFLSIAARAFFTSPTIQFIFLLTKPFQFIAVVHVFRRQTAERALDFMTKLSLFGMGMQAFPPVILWQACVIVMALLRGGNDVEEDWAMVAKCWKDDLVFGLIIVALGLEFGCEKGMPLVARRIDSIIDEAGVGDAMEKGVDGKYQMEG